MAKATNEVLLNEITHVKEMLLEIKEQMKTQATTVEENTRFIQRQSVLNWIHGLATVGILGAMLKIVFGG